MRGRRQRGVALLTVLLVVALAVAVASNMLARHHRSVLKTRYTVYSDQALEYALGA